MPIAAPSTSFTLTYSARWWSFTSAVRGLIESLCGHWNGDAEFAERVATASHELLENAIKYSVSLDSLIACQVELRDRALVLRVENPSAAVHLPRLREEMQFVNDGDPLENYIRKLQAENADQGSHVGLARIRFESEATLSAVIGDDGLVTIEATFTLPEREENHDQPEHLPLSL